MVVVVPYAWCAKDAYKFVFSSMVIISTIYETIRTKENRLRVRVFFLRSKSRYAHTRPTLNHMVDSLEIIRKNHVVLQFLHITKHWSKQTRCKMWCKIHVNMQSNTVFPDKKYTSTLLCGPSLIKAPPTFLDTQLFSTLLPPPSQFFPTCDKNV